MGVAAAAGSICIGELISECMRNATATDDELNESLSNMRINTGACATDDCCACWCTQNEHRCCACCKDCSGDDGCQCTEDGNKCSCDCCNGEGCNAQPAAPVVASEEELTLDQQIKAFEEQLAAMEDPGQQQHGTPVRNSIHHAYSELHNAAAPDLVHRMRLALKDIPEVRPGLHMGGVLFATCNQLTSGMAHYSFESVIKPTLSV